jgi:hypothetical protein
MKNNWQYKILHHTETPPAGVWDSIANALDNEQQLLSEKLQNFETPPPAGIWDKIANKLDEPVRLQQKLEAFEVVPPIGIWDKLVLKLEAVDNNWVEKVSQYEVEPPAKNWNIIEQELNTTNKLAEKLQNFSVEPPLGIWENINNDLNKHQNWVTNIADYTVQPPQNVWAKIDAALNNTNIEVKKPTAKVISFGYKMAAAAAVLIGIVLSTVLLNKKEDIQIASNIKPSIEQPTQPTTNNTNNPEITPTNTTKAIAKTNTDNTKKTASQNSFDIDTNYTKNLVFTTETNQTVSNPAEQLLVKLKNTAGQEVNDMAMLNSPNNYINVTGPNGDQIKVSAKFSKMVNLIKDRDTTKEEYIDKVIKEGAIWKSKFKHWREKMNNSSITPTPANFMDIIELSKILKDNK